MKPVPYKETHFSTKKWNNYWQGKPLKSRNAVEEYLRRYGTNDFVIQKDIASKHGIVVQTITKHMISLRKMGLVQKHHYHVTPREKSVSQKKIELASLRGKIRRSLIQLNEKQLFHILNQVQSFKEEATKK